MKFSFNRKEFVDALLVGGSMAERNKVVPILECVKINVRRESSTISSNDGNVAITKRVSINSDEDPYLSSKKF